MAKPIDDATEFVGKVIADATGMMTLRLCAIGDRLQLFRTIADHGPLTSAICVNGSTGSRWRATLASTRKRAKSRCQSRTALRWSMLEDRCIRADYFRCSTH
jgi:hypothetical protein